MGLFSGDGAGCSARLLKKCGAKVIGGLHLRMPDCIGDEKMLKKSLEENKIIIKKAVEKIQLSVKQFTEGNPTKEGLSILYHIAGLFGQRLWFYGKSTTYKNKPDIDFEKCTSCGLCVKNCPMNNLEKTGGKIISQKGVQCVTVV
jgi:ferredoxin